MTKAWVDAAEENSFYWSCIYLLVGFWFVWCYCMAMSELTELDIFGLGFIKTKHIKVNRRSNWFRKCTGSRCKNWQSGVVCCERSQQSWFELCEFFQQTKWGPRYRRTVSIVLKALQTAPAFLWLHQREHYQQSRQIVLCLLPLHPDFSSDWQHS